MPETIRRRLADVLTASRVPIALGLVVLRRRRRAVIGLFVLGAATDLLDGPVARRLGTASERGARLDSAADATFVAASTLVAATTVDASARRFVGRSAAVVTVTRLAALVVTYVRFSTWSVMHTRLNKAAGLGLAIVGTTALVRGRMPVPALAAVAAVAQFGAIEELAIVSTASEYDPDRRSWTCR